MRSLIVFAVLMALAGSAALAAETVAGKSSGQMSWREVPYVCPMHPEIRASWEADCPKCGMKLVAGAGKDVMLTAFPEKPDQPKADVLYECPMHPEVMMSGPGKCPKCGMKLVAEMKDVAVTLGPEKPDQPKADVLYQCPMHPEVMMSGPGKCPKCGMALVAKSKATLMQEAHSAAGVVKPEKPAAQQPEGMNPSMAAMHGQMLRRRMMLTIRIDNADPAALQAMGDTLSLTQQQATKLAVIAAEARQKAAAVLTAEQKKALSALPNEPASLTDVHRAAPPLEKTKDE